VPEVGGDFTPDLDGSHGCVGAVSKNGHGDRLGFGLRLWAKPPIAGVRGLAKTENPPRGVLGFGLTKIQVAVFSFKAANKNTGSSAFVQGGVRKPCCQGSRIKAANKSVSTTVLFNVAASENHAVRVLARGKPYRVRLAKTYSVCFCSRRLTKRSRRPFCSRRLAKVPRREFCQRRLAKRPGRPFCMSRRLAKVSARQFCIEGFDIGGYPVYTVISREKPILCCLHFSDPFRGGTASRQPPYDA
jgi:hypothetical protein